MKAIRMCMFALAVLLPTSWTLAHAGDDMKDGDKSGETKKPKGKKSKKKEGGGGDDMKQGDAEKK